MPHPSRSTPVKGKMLLLVAFCMNFMFGVLYAWSVFLNPLEEFLSLTRTATSVVPAIGLVCFTIGVFFHSRFVETFSPGMLVTVTLGFAGLGHILFGLVPSYESLVVGFGFLFGGACGTGYGIALYFARSAFSPTSGWAVGLVVAAFAIGGMSVSAVSASVLTEIDVAASFRTIGWVFLVAAISLGAFTKVFTSHNKEHRAEKTAITAPLNKEFLHLAFGYYAFCYLGLAIVSHGKEILGSHPVSPGIPELGPVILNFGYIIGACIGGVVTTRFPNRLTPSVFMAATLLAVVSLNFPAPPSLQLLAVIIVGVGFGSIVSVFVMILSACYDETVVGYYYGRLNVGYGLAGFSAPAVTGWLYDMNGNYDLAIWFAGIVGLLGLAAILRSRLVDNF